MTATIRTCAFDECANLFAPRRRTGRYCSRTCVDLKRHPAAACSAADCDATFRPHGPQRFCSRRCYMRSRRQVDRYGITAADYERMHRAQAGHCQICGRIETVERGGRRRHLCVDHDHTTGKVRGLLCSRCNTALGLLLDEPLLLRSAALYIEQYR